MNKWLEGKGFNLVLAFVLLLSMVTTIDDAIQYQEWRVFRIISAVAAFIFSVYFFLKFLRMKKEDTK